jgi:hypothetical protein
MKKIFIFIALSFLIAFPLAALGITQGQCVAGGGTWDITKTSDEACICPSGSSWSADECKSTAGTVREQQNKDNCESFPGAKWNGSYCVCPPGSSAEGASCIFGTGGTGGNYAAPGGGNTGNVGAPSGGGVQQGAQGTQGGGAPGGAAGSETTIVNPLTTNSFDEIIDRVINFLFYVAMVVVPLMVIVGAFFILTAADDPKKAEQGRQIIFYTIIGLLVVLFAKGLISVLKGVIGVK